MRRAIACCSVLVLVAWGQSSAVAAIDATWSKDGDGSWTSSGNWDIGAIPNNNATDTYNVHIDDDPNFNVTVTLSASNVSVDNLTIDDGDALAVTTTASRSLSVFGSSIVNNGAISLANLGLNSVVLIVRAPMTTLSGDGALVLGGNVSRVQGSPNTNELINGATHTISGVGELGNGSLQLTNEGTIDANVLNSGLVVRPSASGAANSGVMQASNGGTLYLESGIFANAGGTIRALDGSIVWVNTSAGAVTVDGGTLATAGSGVIKISTGNPATLSGITLTSGSLVQIGNSTNPVVLKGTITNYGTIEQNATVSLTAAQIDGDVTLTGAGVWMMSDSANNRFRSLTDTSNVLTNDTEHSIEGGGSLGNNGMGLANFGLIDATGTTALTIDPSAAAPTVVNHASGILRGSGSAGLQLTGGTFDNQGTIEAVDGSNVTYSASAVTSNNLGGVLTGGTWRAIANGGGATLTLQGSSITGIAAGTEVELRGSGSLIRVVATPLEATLTTNDGTLRILDGRVFSMTSALDNNGTVELGGAGLADATLTSGGDITGFGTISGHGIITNAIVNGGTVRASGGTLAISGARITGGFQLGTIQTEAGANLDLSATSADSDALFLRHDGAGLNVGDRSVLVGIDYTNANFGVGNGFDPRAHVTGAGQIDGNFGVAQSLTGDVSGGSTTTATLDFGNVHVGDSRTLNYQIKNSGNAMSARLRGAIQTNVNGANLTDSRLSGAGVTADNFGPIFGLSSTGDLAVEFTATTAGPLTGQRIRVINNFDNVADQALEIAGAAYRLANPTSHTPEPIDFGNFHVGDPVPAQLLSIANDVPNDSFSESLDASIESATGGVTTNGGSFSELAPGAVDSTSLSIGIDTATAGDKSGTASIVLTSNGAGASGLGLTQLASQTVNVIGSVFRLANPTPHVPGPVDFGIVHVGDAVQQALSLSNDVPNDGFSERLNASIESSTGDATTGAGSIDSLLPGATDDTSLVVGINTATAGAKSGTATISVVSTGAGTSELADTPLGPQVVNMSAQVNNFAVANISKLGRNGTFSMTGPNDYTLDLGASVQGLSSLSAELGVTNDVVAPADDLAGSFVLAAPGFSLTGFESFAGLRRVARTPDWSLPWIHRSPARSRVKSRSHPRVPISVHSAWISRRSRSILLR